MSIIRIRPIFEAGGRTPVSHAVARRVAALLAPLVSFFAASCSRAPSLPPVVAEKAAFDFQMRFDEAAVSRPAESAAAPSSGYLFVGTKKAQLAEGGNRPAVILPPPAEATYEVAVPNAECVLRFSLGVGFDSKVEPATVRFEVALDGAPALAEELAQKRKDPTGADWAVDWKECEIPLSAHRNRRVKVTFKTSLAAGPAAGVRAGFAIARLIRKTEVPRLPEGDGAWNVVVALVDTTRADHLSAYGYARPTSPHLEKLAKDGVLYTNAISQASWTWPATTSILTSRYPHAHGILDAERCYLDDSIETVSEAFQAKGYSTYAISANALICEAQNFNQGFETFVEGFRWPADRVTDDFLAWLDRNEKHAFFAYLHYMDPHHPYTPPEKARQAVAPEMFDADDQEALLRVKDGQRNMREVQKLRDDRAHVVALYDAEIRHWDDQFERLVESLRARGVLDRTIIVVTSDHGEEFWEHGHIGHAKTLYQELIRVPLVVYAPRLAKPARVDGLVETIDIFPTLGEMAGLDVPRDVQGRRLPGLSGVRPPERPRDEAYSTTELAWIESDDPEQKMEFRSQEALLGPSRMKLIRQQERPGEPARRELLFDLAKDPGETTNVAAENGALVTEVARKIEAWVSENSKFAPDTGSLKGAGNAALQAMGYIGGGVTEKDKDREVRPIAGLAPAGKISRSVVSGSPPLRFGWERVATAASYTVRIFGSDGSPIDVAELPAPPYELPEAKRALLSAGGSFEWEVIAFSADAKVLGRSARVAFGVE